MRSLLVTTLLALAACGGGGGGGTTARAPGAPTIGTATAGNGQASVAFTPPADDGGAAITRYTVTASPGGRTASGAASPITVTGLTSGTSYTFTVTATNSVGTGPASAASNAVTPAAAGSFSGICQSLFNAQIDLLTSCFHANPAFVNWQVATQQGLCAAFDAEIAAGRIHYDATQGQACSAALQGLGCAQVSQANGLDTPAACQASLVGQVATGGTCYVSNDCATGFCTWDLPSGTCPGTCQPYAGLGQDCAASLCAPGQLCHYDETLLRSVCATQATAAGGPCPCAWNLWCDPSGATPTCRAMLAQGASCDANLDHCATGLVCLGTPPTCRAMVGGGSACTPGSGIGECGFGYRCDDGTSKCVSWPVLGESCLDFPQCLASFCNAQANPTSPTCQPLLADGATCDPGAFGGDCASGFCNGSARCAPGSNAICSAQ